MNEKPSSREVARADLNRVAELEHMRNLAQGWWDSLTGDPAHDTLVELSKLTMMHTEISEAVEGLRTDAMDSHVPSRKSVEVEIVDLLIRIFDFSGKMKLDLNGAWDEKSAYNSQRADHKRENRAKTGGKKF